MGKTAKKLKLDEEEEQLKPLKSQIVLSSDDDEEANEDLSLKIVEKAMLRACSTSSQNDTVLDPSTAPLLEAAEAVQHVKEKKLKKLKKVKKKSKRIEAEDVSVDIDKEVQKAEECKSLETGKLVEEKVDISDNIVLRKLLRGPRYFDPPDSGWGTCYNCGEEGHTTVNCTSAKQKRPCFVCGSLEHNAKQCVKGKDCFVCKKGGHRAKDCPEKRFAAGGPQSAKICLKCGQAGHEMFSCKNEYSSDDLQEIQCYICKSFGHLCCVSYTSAAVGEFSCYRCGQSGHTGLACTRLRGGPNGMGSPSSCYRCGEEGHFARECASSAKVPRRRHESTPKQKCSKQDENYYEGRSLPRDPNTMKREKDRYEGGFSTPSKSKLSLGSITHDTGDLPRRKGKTYSRKSPATPTSNNNKFSYSTAGGSDSYGQARELQFRNSASNDSKIKQPRISSWRFSSSNNGGIS